MKISYVTMQFPALSETFACHDVKSLSELNLNISVHTLKNKHYLHNKMIKDRKLYKIPIYTIGLKEYIYGIAYMFKNFILCLKLFSWLIKNDLKRINHFIRCLLLFPSSFYVLKKLEFEKPDLVHLFWGHYPSLVGYLVKNKLKNTKISFFAGAYDLEYKLNISKYVCNISDYIFTHSKYNLNIFNNMCIDSSRVNVIYRGLNLDMFPKFYTNKVENQFISVGNFIASKRFDLVIELFLDFYSINKNAKLILIGDGPEEVKLKKQVSRLGLDSSVSFLGRLKQEEVFEYMNTSEYFLFLSFKKGERLPNVIKEAMYMGCIPISSNTPGIKELIDNNKTGFIFDENDFKSFTPLVMNLSSQAKVKISNAARIFIVNNFNVKILMKKYKNIWFNEIK